MGWVGLTLLRTCKFGETSHYQVEETTIKCKSSKYPHRVQYGITNVQGTAFQDIRPPLGILYLGNGGGF